MKLLVTGAGALLGQGIIRSLRASTLAPVILAADPSPLSAGLYWADEAFLVPPVADPDYLGQIEALLGRTTPDALLIGTDVELAILAEARPRIERDFGTRVIVSPPSAVAIADDKWLTARFLGEHGFAAPDSALPADADALVARVGYPLVVKPRRGARSIGLSIVHDEVELRAAIARCEAPVIQQHVGSADAEYTASVLVFGGQALASIAMRRDLRDGNSYRVHVDDRPELHEPIRRIAEALGTHGPLNIQFRLVDGKVIPFEFNARFSGTTPLRALAGFNEVELALRHELLGEPIRQPKIRPLTILRHWSETIVDAQRLAELTRG